MHPLLLAQLARDLRADRLREAASARVARAARDRDAGLGLTARMRFLAVAWLETAGTGYLASCPHRMARVERSRDPGMCR